MKLNFEKIIKWIYIIAISCVAVLVGIVLVGISGIVDMNASGLTTTLLFASYLPGTVFVPLALFIRFVRIFFPPKRAPEIVAAKAKSRKRFWARASTALKWAALVATPFMIGSILFLIAQPRLSYDFYAIAIIALFLSAPIVLAFLAVDLVRWLKGPKHIAESRQPGVIILLAGQLIWLQKVIIPVTLVVGAGILSVVIVNGFEAVLGAFGTNAVVVIGIATFILVCVAAVFHILIGLVLRSFGIDTEGGISGRQPHWELGAEIQSAAKRNMKFSWAPGAVLLLVTVLTSGGGASGDWLVFTIIMAGIAVIGSALIIVAASLCLLAIGKLISAFSNPPRKEGWA